MSSEKVQLTDNLLHLFEYIEICLLKALTGPKIYGILRELLKTRQSLIPEDQAPVSFHAPVSR
jgi:hypothetical protein